MKLSDILDLRALAEQIDDNFITVRVHPDDPELKIYNYTPKAQYERYWTIETRQCRGLIVRGDTVLARPFAKFFNYGEGESFFDLDEPAVVMDKADGSLGIIYEAPDGLPAIATRGSFTSDQAIHATNLLRTKYRDWTPEYGYLFEIIYPENRIVLDYGDMDDLILLYPIRDQRWPGPEIDVLEYRTLREALEAPPRENAEGFVVWFVGRNERVKIKQADYLALHKIVTGLSELSVWRHALDNEGDISGLLADLPDEFHQWVKDVYKVQRDAYLRLLFEVGLVYNALIDRIGADADRRTFAMEVQKEESALIRPLLFLTHDQKDLFEPIWKRVRPTVTKESLHDNE